MVEWMTVEVSDLDNRFMETDLMETDPYLIINIGMLVYKQNGHTQGRQSRSMVTGYLEIQILLLNDPSRQIIIQHIKYTARRWTTFRQYLGNTSNTKISPNHVYEGTTFKLLDVGKF